MMYPDPIPQGFTVEPIDQNTAYIHHTRTGMKTLNIFLGIWLIFWGLGCMQMILLFLGKIPAGSGKPVPPEIVFGFCAGEIIAMGFFLYSLFCKQSFYLDYDHLTIYTELLGLKWRKTIAKNAIEKLRQIQDGGRGRDSFPSWGLRIVGRQNVGLIFRQPYEKSYWLGQVIANWAKVPFEEVPRKPKGLFQ